MQILVITGGIGSGKSEVCRILKETYACGVYNADEKVKSLYDTHQTLLSDIENALGTILKDDEGRFLPSLLAERIFSDRMQLELVESMVFPVLVKDFYEWMQDYKDDSFVVFESATILEKPQFIGFGDCTVLVKAPYDLRLSRAAERDGSRVDAEARMSRQVLMNRLSEGGEDERIDFVLDNSGSMDELERKIRDLVAKVTDNTNVTYIQHGC